MKPFVTLLSLVLLAGPAPLLTGQGGPNSESRTEPTSPTEETLGVITSARSQLPAAKPFSLASRSGGISSLGAQFQVATNLNGRMNLRTGVDVLFWRKWITYGGFTAPAIVNLMSSNTSLDVYPFRNHGLRISPGFLIHNPGAGSSRVQLAPVKGGSFTLNGHRYYSTYTPPTSPDPMAPATGPEPVSVIEGLELRPTAFTLTTGWGNMIARKKSGPWSFPVEAGVAFLGTPTVKPTWIQGQVCDAQLQNCQDAATNPEFRNDLQAHFGAYKSHLDLLKTYPIVSFGLAYSFGRHAARY